MEPMFYHKRHEADSLAEYVIYILFSLFFLMDNHILSGVSLVRKYVDRSACN